jgi:hypothetical protein
MKRLFKPIIALIILITAMVYPSLVANSATTCFKKTEYTSGFNKICIYNCMGSDVAITIKNTQLCPLTIQN